MTHEPPQIADIAPRSGAPPGAIYSYRVPPALAPLVLPGQLVWVPLRRQRVQGVVMACYGPAERPPDLSPDPEAPLDPDALVLRDILEIGDPAAALTPAQLRLARWLVANGTATLADALALMLPPGSAQESESTWRATEAGVLAELGSLPERERAVLFLLRRRGLLRERELRAELRGSDTELRATYALLAERGLLERGAALTRPGARPKQIAFVRLLADTAAAEATLADLTRAPAQYQALTWFVARARAADMPDFALPLAAAIAGSGAARPAWQGLEKRALIAIELREVRRDPLLGIETPPDIPPALTTAQADALRPIVAAIDSSVATPFLLHGVTGSGKTEIYLRAIARAMRLGKQALVLVPEIALTTQLVRRFAARFPGRVAVLHSGLSTGERYDEWRRLRRGEAGVIIGSRSAVFAPLPELGLVVVDEEHETSFKHDAAPRYNARDVARQLAQICGAALVLGSATPSIETFHDTTLGRLQLLTLAERVGNVRDAAGLPRSAALPLPPVTVVDMRRELQQGNRGIFSRALHEALNHALEQGEQAILFLNRRGAAASVLCRDCGHVVQCPNCSSPLTPHYVGDPESATTPPPTALVCHGCGHRAPMPLLCPACLGRRIRSFGIGTQRVAEEVRVLFPHARTLRWDRDTIVRKGDHARALDTFLRGEANVLVGTQMIAKGLDLPRVTLVGVVAADTGLHLPDFRAAERTFQLLTQVAGRAGRRAGGGRVVMQTYAPDHYALRAAQEHDYHAFYAEEIAFRQRAGYPPFSRLVRFLTSAGSDDTARRAAEKLAQRIRVVGPQVLVGAWGIIGPAPAFFHVQRNRYRWHLLLRAEDPLPLLNALPIDAGWGVDIDPVNVL